jgi:hypothetical protein
MNFSNILNEIQKADPEVFERTSQRRSILKNFGTKVALASLPLAIGSLFNKAYGKTTDAVTDALSRLLSYKYFEDAVYQKALGTSGLIPASSRPVFEKIAADEAAHVVFLSNLIQDSGLPLPPKPAYDFTGGGGTGTGQFSKAFTDYNEFVELAQMLEDTGVRVFKGEMNVFMPDNDILLHVMGIHSVEARHAAHLRLERYFLGYKPWITGSASDIIGKPIANPCYAKDNNASQLGINLINLNGYTLPEAVVTQAFDEPLNSVDSGIILSFFIKP